MEKINFDNLPQAVSLLLEKVDSLATLLENKSNNPNTVSNKPLSIQEAAKFLKLSVPTIYGMVSRREIPFSKLGKRLYFSESELTEWIHTGRKSTRAELLSSSECVLTPKKTRK
jgi:excisionase family DNA binding protein